MTTVVGVEPLSSDTITKYVLPATVPARPEIVTGDVKETGPTLNEPLMMLYEVGPVALLTFIVIAPLADALQASKLVVVKTGCEKPTAALSMKTAAKKTEIKLNLFIFLLNGELEMFHTITVALLLWRKNQCIGASVKPLNFILGNIFFGIAFWPHQRDRKKR